MLDVSWCIFVSVRFGSKLCTLAEYHSPVNRICGPAETPLGLLVHQSEPRITPEKRSRVKRRKTYFEHKKNGIRNKSLPSGNGHKYSLHLDFLWVCGWYRSRPIFGVDHTRPIGVTNLLKKCLMCVHIQAVWFIPIPQSLPNTNDLHLSNSPWTKTWTVNLSISPEVARNKD